MNGIDERIHPVVTLPIDLTNYFLTVHFFFLFPHFFSCSGDLCIIFFLDVDKDYQEFRSMLIHGLKDLCGL